MFSGGVACIFCWSERYCCIVSGYKNYCYIFGKSIVFLVFFFVFPDFSVLLCFEVLPLSGGLAPSTGTAGGAGGVGAAAAGNKPPLVLWAENFLLVLLMLFLLLLLLLLPQPSGQKP
jgi:hypothetical protein